MIVVLVDEWWYFDVVFVMVGFGYFGYDILVYWFDGMVLVGVVVVGVVV